LVAPQTRVEEIACAAAGAPECRFVVRFDGPAAGAATGRPA
jgi:predicted hydrocarbon binding protein